MASPEARKARATVALIALAMAVSVSLATVAAASAAEVPHPSPGPPVSASRGTGALSSATLTSAALPPSADDSSWLVPVIAGGLLAALLTAVGMSSRVRRSTREMDAEVAPILHGKGTSQSEVGRGRRAA